MDLHGLDFGCRENKIKFQKIIRELGYDKIMCVGVLHVVENEYISCDSQTNGF